MVLNIVYLILFFIIVSLSIFLHIKYKIDWKYACALPIIVMIGVVFVPRFGEITKFKVGGVEIEAAKKQIDNKTNESLKRIEEEATQQRKSLKSLIGRSNEIELERNKIAEEANKKSQMAINIAQQALEQSNSFSAINAEVQWSNLREQYEEIDIILREWEKSRKLKRENTNTSTPENIQFLEKDMTELETKLIKIDKENIPAHIKELYRKRFRQYESLKHASERYKPFTERFASIDFTLPSPPKLPSGAMVIRGGTIRGGTFR